MSLSSTVKQYKQGDAIIPRNLLKATPEPPWGRLRRHSCHLGTGPIKDSIPEFFCFLRDNNHLCSHPPMKRFLLLFACFSLSIHLVFADCDQIQGSNGPTRGSAYNVEVYYRNKSNRRKFIILNRNPYDVRVDLLIGDERRTRMINANKCEDFVRHGFNDCQVLSVRRAH
jgi:hypothetical protein